MNLYRTHTELQTEINILTTYLSSLRTSLASAASLSKAMKGETPPFIFSELEQYHRTGPDAILEQLRTLISEFAPIHYTVPVSKSVYPAQWKVTGFSLDIDYAGLGRSRITIVSDDVIPEVYAPFQHLLAEDVIQLLRCENSDNDGLYTVYSVDPYKRYITLAKEGDPGAQYKLALSTNNSSDEKVVILLRRRP